jgi:hypothetical protein
MDSILWSANRRRSTGYMSASGSRVVSASKSSSVSRSNGVDKELLVYHRRSVQEREGAVISLREREALQGLE